MYTITEEEAKAISSVVAEFIEVEGEMYEDNQGSNPTTPEEIEDQTSVFRALLVLERFLKKNKLAE